MISIGRFLKKRKKKEGLLLFFNLPPFAGVFERFISKKDIWMVRESEGGGETKSIENERSVFILDKRGKVQITMINPYFSLVRVRVF